MFWYVKFKDFSCFIDIIGDNSWLDGWVGYSTCMASWHYNCLIRHSCMPISTTTARYNIYYMYNTTTLLTTLLCLSFSLLATHIRKTKVLRHAAVFESCE